MKRHGMTVVSGLTSRTYTTLERVQGKGQVDTTPKPSVKGHSFISVSFFNLTAHGSGGFNKIQQNKIREVLRILYSF